MRTAHHSKLSAHASQRAHSPVLLAVRCAPPLAREGLRCAALQNVLLLRRRTSVTFTHSHFTVARPSVTRLLGLCLCSVR